MEIYLLRHGAAENAEPGGRDADRNLTDEGRKKTEAVVKLAKHAGVEPSLIICSPYARAAQTAELAAAGFNYKGSILRADALVPHSSPPAVWNEIRDHRGEPSILLAGHEPLLSQLAAYMLAAPSLQVEMKKSAMVRIDVAGFRAAPQGVLRWMIVPALTK